MSLRKNGIGYYVEGRNGLPGRSFPKLQDAQRYDQELERAACPPPKTTTQLLAELYSDLVRWRDAGGDVRELRYVFETMDQISAEKALRLITELERELTAARAVIAYANTYRARTGRCFFCGFGSKLNGDEFHGTGCVLNAYNQVVAKGAL